MRKHLRRKSNSEFSVVFFLVEGRKEWIGLFWFLFCLNITSFSVLLSFSSLTNGMGLREIKYARALLLFSLHFSFGFFFQVVESISDTSVVVYTLLCKNRRHWNQTRCILLCCVFCFCSRIFFLATSKFSTIRFLSQVLLDWNYHCFFWFGLSGGFDYVNY